MSLYLMRSAKPINFETILGAFFKISLGSFSSKILTSCYTNWRSRFDKLDLIEATKLVIKS